MKSSRFSSLSVCERKHLVQLMAALLASTQVMCWWAVRLALRMSHSCLPVIESGESNSTDELSPTGHVSDALVSLCLSAGCAGCSKIGPCTFSLAGVPDSG